MAPDQPETLIPAQSIRHETKVQANDIYLLQNERTIDQTMQPNFNTNSLENRNDRSNYEFTKMIANGILAAEALEKSVINKTGNSVPVVNTHHGEPIEPLPIFLTPPRTISDRPFRYETRIPLRERNHSMHYILPNHAGNRFKNFNGPPMIKVVNDQRPKVTFTDRQKVTKISMPPIRRDYVANVKPVPQFPVQNQPWSLQKHIIAMRGGSPPPPQYLTKQKFSGPIKISKKEFSMPAKNIGFQPDSVVVEGGFTPIMKRTSTHEHMDYESKRHEIDESEDYPEQTQRRSDRTDLMEENNTESENPELLIKTFEPMFIPSPLDSTSSMKTPNKRLTGDLQYMEMEEGEDKMALAGERHAYYLPPENGNSNKVKSTKLYPAGVVVTYDGRAVVDRSLLDSEPDFPTPKRPGTSISSTEQLLHLPQFGPFRGEFPPLTPELMKPNIRPPQRSA